MKKEEEKLRARGEAARRARRTNTGGTDGEKTLVRALPTNVEWHSA